MKELEQLETLKRVMKVIDTIMQNKRTSFSTKVRTTMELLESYRKEFEQ